MTQAASKLPLPPGEVVRRHYVSRTGEGARIELDAGALTRRVSGAGRRARPVPHPQCRAQIWSPFPRGKGLGVRFRVLAPLCLLSLQGRG